LLIVFARQGDAADQSAQDGVGNLDGVNRPEMLNNKLVTGVPGELIGDSTSRWSAFARHQYSKIQPWNCNESLLWVNNFDNQGTQVFLTGNGEEVVSVQISPGSELRWTKEHPDEMYYVSGHKFGRWNVRSGATTVLMEFTDLADLRIGPYEGNVSRDGRFLVLTGIDSRRSDSRLRSNLVDITTRQVVSTFLHSANSMLDWVSVSASGKYIVMNGRLSPGLEDVSQVYDQQFEPLGPLWAEYGRPSHYDLTIDLNGDDVAVGVSKSKPDDGQLIARRLRDGKISILIPKGYARHTSARNTQNPEWVFVTYEGKLENWPPFSNEIVALKLDGTDLYRLVHYNRHYGGNVEKHDIQAQAVPSPTAKYLAWAQSADSSNEQYVGLAVIETGITVSGSAAVACSAADSKEHK